MDYEKKYKEALENIKKIKAANKDNKELIDFIEYNYPELKESEDERIRKHLLKHFRNKTNEEWNGMPTKNILAWLEKQGEKKPAWSEEDERIRKTLIHIVKGACDKYGIKYQGKEITEEKLLAWLEKQGEKKPAWSEEDERIRKTLIHIVKGACDKYGIKYQGKEITEEKLLAWLEKQGEKKPAWSEEDEKGLGDTLWAIEQARTIAKDENEMGNLWYAEKWLKSLKERYSWKPSDEQMKAMQKALVDLCGKDEHNIITCLYYDLKKLREE